MEKKEVLLSFPKLEKVFLIHSELTRLPFVECDEVTFDDVFFLFETKENADKKARELLAKNQKVSVVELDQDTLLKTFTHLAVAGVNAVKYNYHNEDFIVQLDEIVRISDFSDLPPEKRPVENRTLQLTMLYFCQEIRTNLENPNVQKIKELEEEMMVNILKARFLVPVREAQVEGNTQMQMIMLKVNDDVNMIPVFTDNIEFDKMPNDENVKKVVVEATNLINYELPPECSGYLINPMAASLPMNSSIINNLRNLEIVSAPPIKE